MDDSHSGAGPIAITLNTTVQPASLQANNPTKSYTISGSGSIAGGAAINVNQAGGLTLAGTNAYVGGTTVTAPGQLNINYGGDGVGNYSAIGMGALTINTGAKIDNTSGHAVTLNTPTPIQQFWNDDWTFLGSTNLNLGIGGVTMGNSLLNLTVVTNTLEVDGQINDNGQVYKLIKLGAGTLVLGTDNFFSGGFELNGGEVALKSANSWGNGL